MEEIRLKEECTYGKEIQERRRSYKDVFNSSIKWARSSSKVSTLSEDLETAISKTGCGKFNLALLLLSLPASWTNGFVTGAMSYVIPAASSHLQLTPTDKAMLQSACYAGMIVSGFFWGFLSDAFGRKKLLVLGYFSDFLMSVLAGAFPVLPLMLFFKFLSGFMICGPFSIFTTYISEVFISERRDFAVLSTGLFSAAGQIVLAALALWIIPAEIPSNIPFESWQIFHMVCSLPSLISGFGCLFCVESPKFLADKGDQEGALKVCRKIYTINTGDESTNYSVKRIRYHPRANDKKKSNFEKFMEGMDIFKSPFIMKALVMFLIQLGAAASQNTLRLWLPEMLILVKSSDMDADLGLCRLLSEGHSLPSNSTLALHSRTQVYVDMMFINLCCVLGHLTFLFIVKYLGTRNMVLCTGLISGSCALAIPFISADKIFILASVYLSFYNITIYCNINIMVEVFPTRMRATSVSILMLIARIGILFVNFLIANLIYTYCQYFFYTLTVVGAIIAVLTFFIPRHQIEDRPLPDKQEIKF